MLASSPLSPLARYAGVCDEFEDIADDEKEWANNRGGELLL